MQATDGLPARCVGPWSRDKLYYVERYLSLFTRAMARRFPVRHYVDLFAGPGRCVLDDDSGEIDGSPLVALKVAPPFTAYHFGDADASVLETLRRRVEAGGHHSPALRYYTAAANDAVAQVAQGIPPTALSLV